MRPCKARCVCGAPWFARCQCDAVDDVYAALESHTPPERRVVRFPNGGILIVDHVYRGPA